MVKTQKKQPKENGGTIDKHEYQNTYFRHTNDEFAPI